MLKTENYEISDITFGMFILLPNFRYNEFLDKTSDPPPKKKFFFFLYGRFTALTFLSISVVFYYSY